MRNTGGSERRTLLIERNKEGCEVNQRNGAGGGRNDMDIVEKTDAEQMLMFISWRDEN